MHTTRRSSGRRRLTLWGGRPSDGGHREGGPGKEEPLAVLGARVAYRLIFSIRLDTLGDHDRAELVAKVNDDGDQLLLSRLSVEILNEVPIELYDFGL